MGPGRTWHATTKATSTLPSPMPIQFEQNCYLIPAPPRLVSAALKAACVTTPHAQSSSPAHRMCRPGSHTPGHQCETRWLLCAWLTLHNHYCSHLRPTPATVQPTGTPHETLPLTNTCTLVDTTRVTGTACKFDQKCMLDQHYAQVRPTMQVEQTKCASLTSTVQPCGERMCLTHTATTYTAHADA